MIYIGFIYKITNDINQKVYIGKTTKTIAARWKQHLYDCTNPNKRNTHFYRAIQKYGVEHFHIEEIEKCPNSELDIREAYWIKEYDSFNTGYNSTLGGDGGDTFNHKSYQSPVCKISLVEDKILERYESIAQAAENLGDKRYAANISACCRGAQKQAYGYRWSYQNEIRFRDIKHGRHKKVFQIDVYKVQIINEFDTVADAAYTIEQKREGVASTQIATAARNTVYKGVCKPYGYAWAYEETLEDILNKLLQYNRYIIKMNPDTQEILQYFSSKTSAQRSVTGKSYGTIVDKLHQLGDVIRYKGFLWKMVNKI